MYKFLLCLRYLRTRYIALASIVSVMLGVATMVVVNSVMAGFGTEMRERIHGILADVIIETNNFNGEPDAEKHFALVQQAAGRYVEAMTATVEVYGILSFQFAGQWIHRPVTLIGIEPDSKSKVGPLIDYLESYKAVRQGETVGVTLRSPNELPNWSLTAEAATYRQQRVRLQQQWEQATRLEHGADVPGSASPFDGLGAQGEVNHTGAEATDSSVFPAVGTQEVKDLSEPLAGRLIVGAGLIEFPYEDRETGKIRTMKMVRPGDDVAMSTVSAGTPDVCRFPATVVDVFKSGMSEYDSNLVFCNLEYLQEKRGMFDPSSGRTNPQTGEVDPKTCVRSITTIQIKLKDFQDADEVVRNLRAAFPPGLYTVKTWEQKQGPLLAAVEVESAILNVLLFLIIAVAGFGILAIFYMIVVEKTRDIGILKSLGASAKGIMSIFLSYGLALGIVGSGVGVVLGLLFVRYINQIEKFITWITGRKVFDERIYYFPEIPTSVNPMMVVWVALGAMAIAVLASVLPARRASRLHPVEALRYE